MNEELYKARVGAEENCEKETSDFERETRKTNKRELDTGRQNRPWAIYCGYTTVRTTVYTVRDAHKVHEAGGLMERLDPHVG